MLKTLIFCDGCSTELSGKHRWRVQAEGGWLVDHERQVYHYCPGCIETPFQLSVGSQ